MAYPIPQTAAQLTLAEFKAFATAHAYPHPQQLPAALARLRDPYPVAAATTVEVYAGEAQQLATLLLEIIGARNEQERAIHVSFRSIPIG